MKTIVLMPVKNEDWILKTSLDVASKIADHVIVADQQSTDDSNQIYKQFKKVVVIDNDSTTGHSNEVRWKLLDKCRELFGINNLIVCLDADEIVTPSTFNKTKQAMQSYEPGKVWFESSWVQIWKTIDVFRNDLSVWNPTTNIKPFCFIDDGKIDYERSFVINDHTSRIPGKEKQIKRVKLPLSLLHFQFANWNRAQEKQAWYRCKELINGGNAHQINEKYSITKEDSNTLVTVVPKERWYSDVNISYEIERNIKQSWYVDEIKIMLETYGTDYFNLLDIWHVPEIQSLRNKTKI